MTRPAGGGWSLPTKLLLLAIATQLVVLGLLAWISGTTGTTRVLALAAPLVIPLFIVFFLARWIVLQMNAMHMAAYRRVATGDYRADLPPLAALILGSDFVDVRAAFTAMGVALERSAAALRDADLDRRRLFANLAHELATPISTFFGIIHALSKDIGDRTRLLEHLDQESERFERLIADIREIAHIEDPALTMALAPCDLGELAERAIDRARLAAPISCQLRCDAVPTPACADRLRIDQVLTNLLGNAIRHAPSGVVAVAVRPDGSDAVLCVEDSGAGVPDDLLPQLGRRLLRVDPSRSRDTGGHGLGLSIVHGIVARHHGRVSFARATLGGLSVEVRLPCDLAASADPIATPAEPDQTTSSCTDLPVEGRAGSLRKRG